MGQSTKKKLLPPSIALLDRHRGPASELYAATVTVSGGEASHGRASGIARSDDGALNLALRMPHELGGPGGGTNPEQLFAAGYAACFHGALMLLATRAGINASAGEVSVKVTFGRDPVDGLYMLAADVRVSLPQVPKAVAEELIRNAERVCPYAKMARHGIDSVVALTGHGA